MRLNEGDRVVGIAAFRAGLAERDGMGDDDAPGSGGPGPAGPERCRERDDGLRPAGGGALVRGPVRDLPRQRQPGAGAQDRRYLGTEPGKAEVFQFANENIFVKILDNVREKDVFLVQPTSHPVNQSIMELLIMIDAFKRASAPAGSPRSSRSTPTAGRTRRTSRACRSRPASSPT